MFGKNRLPHTSGSGFSGSLASGQFLAPNGTVAAPGYAFSGAPNTGFLAGAGGATRLQVAIAGVESLYFTSATDLSLPAGTLLGWASTASPSSNARDTSLSRDVAGMLAVTGAANADAGVRKYGGNSGFEEWGSLSENLVLSTGGSTTDTAANLLPANSIIEAVTGRVTTTIVTATDWKLGDAATPGRFSAANAVLVAGTTQVGTVQADQTAAAGPRQVAAAKVRVTTTGVPSAGAIRITSYYRSFTPATS